jgi:multisubunit Na+/H+ antiporter MnhF subunit
MIVLEIIKYLLKFTLISCIQVFSFVYYLIKAENITDRILALKEGLAAISYVSAIFICIMGSWEIGILIGVLAVAYTNYCIHDDSKELIQKKSTC